MNTLVTENSSIQQIDIGDITSSTGVALDQCDPTVEYPSQDEINQALFEAHEVSLYDDVAIGDAKTPGPSLEDGIYDGFVENAYLSFRMRNLQPDDLGVHIIFKVEAPGAQGGAISVDRRFALSWEHGTRLRSAVTAILGRPLTTADIKGGLSTSDLKGLPCRVHIVDRTSKRRLGGRNVMVLDVLPCEPLDYSSPTMFTKWGKDEIEAKRNCVLNRTQD